MMANAIDYCRLLSGNLVPACFKQEQHVSEFQLHAGHFGRATQIPIQTYLL